MNPSSRTPLAGGTINGNTRLRIELIEPNRGKPPVIAIDWPTTPTVCEPAQLHAIVAAAMRILAKCCHPRRHPSTTEALAAQEKTPRKCRAGAFSLGRWDRAMPTRQLVFSAVNADEWAALGQVGSFVVAIGALIFAIVSRKDSKEALRSATAAEVIAQAAKDAVREAARANELTESDQRERASTQAAREQHEAELVSGSIVIEDGGLIDSERIEVYRLRVTVENHSSQPVHDVTFRHTQHQPSFQLLDRMIAPGGQQLFTFPVEPFFETLRDGTELIRGTEIKYKLARTVHDGRV